MPEASTVAEIKAAVERGEIGRAGTLVSALLDIAPSNEALHLAALIDARSGNLTEAAVRLEQLLSEAPKRASWYCDLGTVRLSLERWSDAVDAFQSALEIDSACPRGWRGLSQALAAKGRQDEAVLALQRSLNLDPFSKSAHALMAAAYRRADRHSKARRHEEEVLRLDPGDSAALARVALDCWRQDDLSSALRYSQEVVDKGTATAFFHAIHLYLKLYDPQESGQGMRAASEEWRRRHCLPPEDAHVTDPDPERKLRLGYLSPEFSGGPPLFFLPPILAAHDRNNFEVYLYHASPITDEHTTWYRQQADCWRDCYSMTDDELLRTIREDRVDILIDPSGYSHDHRLTVMARRAAPIQVNYPDYPGTRGIEQIDYILTDRWATPEGTESEYTEAPIRLPSGYLAYVPPSEAPSLTPLPADRNGFITYGLFQRRIKINDGVLDAVAEVLRRAPDSTLLIQCNDRTLDLPDSETRTNLTLEFLSRGIPSSRIRMVGARPRHELMALIAEADVALDTFPFAGQTTTCECLWMGVPVITLTGDTHASRVGASIMNSVGLPRFVGHTPSEYVQIALEAAGDREALRELRSGMRERLAQSGFVGSSSLCREMEAAIRKAWRCWCEAAKATAAK